MLPKQGWLTSKQEQHVALMQSEAITLRYDLKNLWWGQLRGSLRYPAKDFGFEVEIHQD